MSQPFEVGDVSPKYRVGDSRLAPVVGWQLMFPTGWSQIAVRTPGHCRLAPTNLSAKGCYHWVAYHLVAYLILDRPFQKNSEIISQFLSLGEKLNFKI
ncbi:MAG: hypothetical protein LBC02_09395 [Planctomycetaceae bacterium]|nr:hypothetical protein [Planctomycetaceae bacterium]